MSDQNAIWERTSTAAQSLAAENGVVLPRVYVPAEIRSMLEAELPTEHASIELSEENMYLEPCKHI